MSQSRQERRAAMRQMMKEMQKERKQLDLGAGSAISEAKLAANKANALLSTGPVTPEGKATSSQNNFKHGLYSKQLIMKGENPADLDALKADLITEHQPANTTEELLVNEMAEQYWRLKRARRIETSIFSADSLVIPHMNAVQRLMASAERGFHKALKTLRELQKQRGFVPQKHVTSASVTSRPAPVNSAGFESQKQVAKPSIDELNALEAEFQAIEKLLKAA
jgi:hypothetical protein